MAAISNNDAIEMLTQVLSILDQDLTENPAVDEEDPRLVAYHRVRAELTRLRLLDIERRNKEYKAVDEIKRSKADLDGIVEKTTAINNASALLEKLIPKII